MMTLISAWSFVDDCKKPIYSRREGIKQILSSSAFLIGTTTSSVTINNQPAIAYTPDSNPLRESLYFISRVQEATVQQERFVNRSTQQDVLKNKMKLTLRLVEKNYRLLDQITYCAEYITPESKVVEATTVGYEAAEALQNAIDYVNADLKAGDFENGQKEYLISNLKECRECLFDFLSYMPQDDLASARKRVEEGEFIYSYANIVSRFTQHVRSMLISERFSFCQYNVFFLHMRRERCKSRRIRW